MDNFYEQLVKTTPAKAYGIANGLLYVFAIFAAVFLSTGRVGGIILAVIFAALTAAVFYFKKYLYAEYEYNFGASEIDFDAIYELKKRKRLITINVKDIELLAPADSDVIKDFSNKPSKIMNLYPKGCENRVYSAIVTGGTKKVTINFTPDEKMIDLCFRVNPKAVKKNL
ncbi:hypothetical protein IAI10_17855 [Clostridium sp. 19966]|uniref:hypothetical protein n=1 Tax=Clostridium sp. 19966 TaxID=2768166 RepID=UPI0028DF60E4|nr:hypothetical protein [Clostridium sp. 19966]MDT8718533.1 hypothetical protein [Clostridium sp. 19966]